MMNITIPDLFDMGKKVDREGEERRRVLNSSIGLLLHVGIVR